MKTDTNKPFGIIIKQLTAGRDGFLSEYLLSELKEFSRKRIKQFFKFRLIRVNDKSDAKHNHPIKKGDVITIIKENPAVIDFFKMRIIFEDNDIIVIEKDAGLLSIATEKGRDITAYSQLFDYVKRKKKKERIFIVHRLDRDTSGVLIFAKSEEIKNMLQDNWNEIVKDRKYIALTEGTFLQKQGTIQSRLNETKTFRMYSDNKEGEGKLAVTNYKVLRQNKRYSLVEAILVTGRKNQIRAHLTEAGHPVAGDIKYGAKTNPCKRLMLHASTIRIIHPVTGKEVSFSSELPHSFFQAFG